MINLKEIIWEVTTECNNNCDYCGTSAVLRNLQQTEEDILKIARAIAKYPAESINISGGDPTLVNINVHIEMVRMFRKAGIQPKIIVNPISISGIGISTFVDIINLYDAVGISINNETEYALFNEHLWHLDMSKITIISNFNKANLWMFNQLLKLVIAQNLPWQVMVTMFLDEDLLAIYESTLATDEFFKKIKAAQQEYTRIVLADNINTGECTAGTNSLGILASGDVVPCLSMRAWHHDVEAHIQGNLLTSTDDNPLQVIWENGFKEQRFAKWASCKEHCNNITLPLDTVDWRTPKHIPDLTDRFQPVPKHYPDYVPKPEPNIIMVYGVVQPTSVPGHTGNPPFPNFPTTSSSEPHTKKKE